MSRRRLNVLYLTVMGMEGCCLYAFAALMDRQVAGGQLSLAGLMALYPVAFLVDRLLRRTGWHSFFRNALGWLAWFPAMMLTIKLQLYGGLAWSDPAWARSLPEAFGQVFYVFRPELVILVVAGVAWWLGQRLSGLKLSFGVSVAEFQFGLILLALMAFMFASFEIKFGEALPLALAFFFFALTAISLSHSRETSSWLTSLNRAHWTGLLLISIGVILVLGLAVSAMVNPAVLQVIFDFVKLLWGAFWELVFKLLALIASLFPPPEPVEMPGGAPMPTAPPDESFTLSMPENLRKALQFAWMIGFFGLFFFAMWRVSSGIIAWLKRRLASPGAEYETMRGAFRADLLGWLKRLLSLLGLRRFLRPRPAPLAPEVSTVRQIYVQLLGWAAAGGHPRGASETPYEYLYALSGSLAEHQTELRLITHEYVRTRYGGSRIAPPELAALKGAWGRLRAKRLVKTKGESDGKNG
ncbi:MAG: DUF4129 domain-containing protein [Chloroflexi bacterium]|nr:DUF4129 domain-containing protein [Chloroflexota bacterium]